MNELEPSQQEELARALEARESQLQGAIAQLRENIASPAAGMGPEVRDSVEDGDARMMSSLDLTDLGRREQELGEVMAARMRMRQGRYGLCEACEEPIPLARLRAKPEARFCLQDEEQWEKDHPQAVTAGGSVALP